MSRSTYRDVGRRRQVGPNHNELELELDDDVRKQIFRYLGWIWKIQELYIGGFLQHNIHQFSCINPSVLDVNVFNAFNLSSLLYLQGLYLYFVTSNSSSILYRFGPIRIVQTIFWLTHSSSTVHWLAGLRNPFLWWFVNNLFIWLRIWVKAIVITILVRL